MIDEHDESNLFYWIKAALCVVLIGFIYYAGGSGIALIITKDTTKRRNYGNYNIVALAIEVVILLWALIYYTTSPPLSVLLSLLLNIIVFHAILTLIGLLIYMFWSLYTWLFPSGQNSSIYKTHNETDDQKKLLDHKRRAIDHLNNIQSNLNNATDIYLEDRLQGFLEIENQRAQARNKLIQDLRRVIDLYGDHMNQSIKNKFDNMEDLSPEDLTCLSEVIQSKLVVFLKIKKT